MVRTQEDTSIPLKKSTRKRLGTLGNKNESWDSLLNRKMDESERMEKELEMLSGIRDIVYGPNKHHIMNSTPEEIDSLDLSGLMPDIEIRIKDFWKRFAKGE